MSVSLKIKGNKYSSEGVGIDHVAIGDKAFIVNDRQYPPVARAGYGIVVQHYADKSVYTMVIANVSSVDGSRQGSLYIALSVPVGEYVKGLYNLLIQLADFYRNNYLTPFGNGYRFADRKEDEAEFAAILAAYPVSHYPYRPIVNAEGDSVAYVCAPVEEVAAILDDPMRDEFAPYSRVVLIPAGNPADATLTVAPGANRPYSLTVNGLKVSATVTDPDKTLNISVPETKALQAATVRFTLNEARTGGVKGASVTIDDYAQTISVNVHQPRKPQPVPQPQAQSATREPIAGGRRNRKESPWLIGGIVLAVLAFGLIAAWLTGIFGGKDKNYFDDNQDMVVQETIVDEESRKEEFEEEVEQDAFDNYGYDENYDYDSDYDDPKLKSDESVEVPDAGSRNDSGTRDGRNSGSREGRNSGSREGGTPPRAEGSDPRRETPATPARPTQDPAVKEAYDNVHAKLTLSKPITKGEFKDVQSMLTVIDFTSAQKAELQGLVDAHKQFHQALSSVKSSGAEGLREALEKFSSSTNCKPLKNYAIDKLKLEDKDLEQFAVRFGMKRDRDNLY